LKKSVSGSDEVELPIPLYRGEKAVKVTRVKEPYYPGTTIPRCLITAATCPFCNVTVKVYGYNDERGTLIDVREEGTRECKHFVSFRDGYAIFKTP